jgi:hypothetical protein
MHDPVVVPPRAVELARPRSARALLLGVAVAAAIGLGACSAGASSLPSVSLPSVALPTANSSASPLAACVNPAMMAMISQLKAPGADMAGLLAANKDMLAAGLATLQPADPATIAWRDAMVKALKDGDMTTAQARMADLAGGGVSLTAC